MALRNDGTVVEWNTNRLPAGLTDVVAISASRDGLRALALRSDGSTVVGGNTAPAPASGNLDTYNKHTLSSVGLLMTASPAGASPGRGIPLHPRYDPYGTPAKLAGNRTVPLVWAFGPQLLSL